MKAKHSVLVIVLELLILFFHASWTHAQSATIDSEHVYRIRATCAQEGESFGTGFLSREHKAIVTALHVVDGACSITATSEKGEFFGSLCVQHTSQDYDIAILTSIEIDALFDSSAETGYEMYPIDEGLENGGAVSFGYAQNTNYLLSRDSLVLESKSQLKNLVFQPDLEKWAACDSPALDAEVFRIEGIASGGDSGGPIFKDGDPRVFSVVSGGRALDNVIWATSLSDASASLQTHACPNTLRSRVRDDACSNLRYFYSEDEEKTQRTLLGLPLLVKESEPTVTTDSPITDSQIAGTNATLDSDPVSIAEPILKPLTRWYQKPWVWWIGAAIGGTIIATTLDDDDPEPANTNTLTIPLP